MTHNNYQLIMLLSMVINITAAPHTESHDVLAYDCMMKPTGSQWLLLIVGQLGVIIVQNLYYFFE